ncbi:MAG TPA: type II toxin-antitoxin system VapC family toxin [Rhizomicrobium sp.]|jgi:predicted nucleic acid-binding protein|nr:type II toxin-antitoxin system VapC family toxin [Rhizomicrobium sp.]
MLAVDTNIVVRYLVSDHPDQFAKATAVIEQNDVYISRTVMLETEWVLRSLYGYDRARLVEALLSVAGLPRVLVEDSVGTLNALNRLKRGFDFADAMHLAGAQNCDAFITFDAGLAKIATRTGANTPAVKTP